MDSHECNSGSGKPPSVAGRLGLSLFFLFFFAMGSLFELFTVREFGRALGQRTWQKTPCQIVSSEVQEHGSSKTPYLFAVSYQYEHAGRPYTGSAYKRNYSGSDKYSDTQALVRKYPPGGSLFCYVNPGNPGEAVLQRDSLAIGLVILFPLIFMLIGAGGIYFIWRRQRPEVEKPIAATAVPKGGKSLGKYGLAAFFAVFAVVGGIMLYPLGIRPIAKTVAAESWVTTPCTVLRAEVRSHDSDDGTTYSVYILYQYEFNRQTYKSDRYEFVGGSSSGYQGKARVVEQYEAATNPVCYVNPNNPSEAVLKRGFHAKLLLALFPLPFLLVGIGGLAGTLRGKITTDDQTAKPWTIQQPGGVPNQVAPLSWRGRPALASRGHLGLALPDPDVPVGSEVQGRDALATAAGLHGRVILAPRFSAKTRFIGMTVIAVFWNGVISIFAAGITNGFRHGDPSWLGLLFLLPFVAVGLGLIGVAAYQFLAMFNPRPTLALSSSIIPLGTAAQLTWSFSGRTGRISEFVVTLRGVEEARYRKGTSTYTDRNTFYEMELYKTSDPNEIASGQVGFVVPQDTMHSFEAENNRILWNLDVRGSIKHWPDVKESFKITVTPAAPRSD
jgi:hypothetical protein